MNYIYLGKIVNTHGIKGEIRIISDFEYKNHVFKNNFNIYIGKEKNKEVIATYRPHKNFDMVTLKGYNNINEVLKYKGSMVFINRDELVLKENEYLKTDLLNFDVIIDNNVIGTLVAFENHFKNIVMIIKNNEKSFLVPYHQQLIESIDFENKQVIIKNIKGLVV